MLSIQVETEAVSRISLPHFLLSFDLDIFLPLSFIRFMHLESPLRKQGAFQHQKSPLP